MNLTTTDRIWVSPPFLSIPTTRPAFIEWHSITCMSKPPSQNFAAKRQNQLLRRLYDPPIKFPRLKYSFTPLKSNLRFHTTQLLSIAMSRFKSRYKFTNNLPSTSTSTSRCINFGIPNMMLLSKSSLNSGRLLRSSKTRMSVTSENNDKQILLQFDPALMNLSDWNGYQGVATI